MTVSDAFKAAVFAPETGEAFITLLEIDHDNLSSPIYLCSDGIDTTSNGTSYTAFPFSFVAPASASDREPQAKLEIDNISREIVEAIRVLTSPPTISISLVRASVPDTIEVTFPNFYLNDIYYDKYIVSGTLVIDSLTNEPFPASTFTPAYFPGLFGGTV